MVTVVIHSGLTLGGIKCNLGAGLDAGTAVANTIQTILRLNTLGLNEMNTNPLVQDIWK